jgi:Cu(I)/Ag(I) efflux system membrane fusion protein
MQYFYAILFLLASVTVLAEQDHSTHLPSKAQPLELGADSSNEIFKFICPMHPQIIRDHQGICPICGMDLVKKKFDISAQSPVIGVNKIGADGLKQGLAIRTTRVQKTTLWQYIPTFGKVVPNKNNVVHIHTRSIGWLSDLGVVSEGDYINKGELLYRLYSPEIVSAQQDLLLALQNIKRQGNKAQPLLNSARNRLKLLNLSDVVIKLIEKGKKVINDVPFYAPQSGVAVELIVQNGMFVNRNIQLMKLENYSSVWVEAEVLPLQQQWVKKNLSVNIETDAVPNHRWESSIEYIYPIIDSKTQALKIRLPLANQDSLLKPNMLVNVEIYGGPKHEVLAIPQEAIIDDGQQKRVVVQQADGKFSVQKVVTGMVSRDIVEIYSGLNENDKIVISGQFLIDSESQIQSNLRRLLTTPSH